VRLLILFLAFALAVQAQQVRVTLWQQRPTLSGPVETPKKKERPKKTWWQRNRGWVLPVVVLGGGIAIVGIVLHSQHGKDCNPGVQTCATPCVPGDTTCFVRD
jgi:hypothetical protein